MVSIPTPTVQEVKVQILLWEKVAAIQENFRKAFAAVGIPQDQFLKGVSQLQLQQELLKKVGLLPHESTPIQLLNNNLTDKEYLESVRNFYEDNWSTVSEGIKKRVHNCNVDEEAKATFEEGLRAFEQGLYRSVCRTLLPEIERVVRIEVRGGKPGKILVKSFIESMGGKLTPSQLVPSGLFGLTLFRCLVEHVYKEVGNTADQAKVRADPIPNRHAAIHGLVSYNSYWNALNTIFMADFAFQIVDAVKSSNVLTKSLAGSRL